ncbi:hypothetical protein QCA50_016977 [Cerrena zonata]|uniref:C2H2-type domain-containing protein n=1 Tax=Cerrena zonata TaxID=2478898 RepID=A0AAW0FHF8_9APHY
MVSQHFPFPCVEGCSRGSFSERGLSIHQSNCKHVKKVAINTRQRLAKKFEARSNARKALIQRPSPQTSRHSDECDFDTIPGPLPFSDFDLSDPGPSIQTDVSQPDTSHSEEPIPETSTGRGHRKKRPTWKVIEQRRVPIIPVPTSPMLQPPPEPPTIDLHTYTTTPDHFGLFRQYHALPSPNSTRPIHIPISIPTIIHPASNVPPSLLGKMTFEHQEPDKSSESTPPDLAGCTNHSTRMFMEWYWRSKSKSLEDANYFVHNVLLHDDFLLQEMAGFDARRETAQIDVEANKRADRWQESDVNIYVPDGHPHVSPDDGPIPIYSVKGLIHCSITEIIKDVWSQPSSTDFEYIPYRLFWSQEGSPTEQVHGELYTSEAFNRAYEDLLRQPGEPDCSLERVICGLMMYSDSTHLSNFGDAALWPIYMYFGNQSKYTRARPSSGSCHHLAYIPKLPDDFHDFYVHLTGDAPPAEVLTHCRREVMHGVWRTILDDDFLHAYEHGIVIRCADGILRRVYPRIFTYSADYPEKVLLATIRNLGKCPCVRCKIEKDQIPEMGMDRDMKHRGPRTEHIGDIHLRRKIDDARRAIFHYGKGVKSTSVEDRLANESYVPTSNAFLDHLAGLGVNIFALFTVDFLHEVELGVWKALFIHLIRMLFALGGDLIQHLNERYRSMPSFCRSTIRKFHNNVSAMKKLAARDFEDILQCAIAVFDGLFEEPTHNKAIMDLLFVFTEWHANAKLRQHHTSTLTILNSLTRDLGRLLRHFTRQICPLYDTKELP